MEEGEGTENAPLMRCSKVARYKYAIIIMNMTEGRKIWQFEKRWFEQDVKVFAKMVEEVSNITGVRKIWQ